MTREGDLIRSEDDRDPENIGEYIDRVADEFATPRNSELFALREMFYYLRREREVRFDDLQDVGWDASSSIAPVYGNVGPFWAVARRWFELLPGVHPPDEGETSAWEFDAADHDRPPVPENPNTPDEEELEAVLRNLDHSGDISTVRRMYKHLEEHGRATSSNLMEFKSESQHDQRQYGRYTDRGDWFREQGRPALLELPGIARPAVLGGEWTFVGISPDDLEPAELDGIDPDVVDALLESAPVGGRGAWAEKRRETIREMFEAIREDETATRSDLRELVDAQAVGYAGRSDFLDEIATAVLVELPGIRPPDEGETSAWEFDADQARTETERGRERVSA